MKLLLPLLLLLSFNTYAIDSVSVTGVKPIPAKVVQNTTVNGLIYNVHNNSATATYTIGFIDLKQQGITYTTTCGQLAPGADCSINMTFAVPSLPTGVTSAPYRHWFGVTGAPRTAGYVLQSTIIQQGSDVTPDIDIGLSAAGVTTATNAYDVTLTPSGGGSAITCNSMVFGTSNFCQAVAMGEYSATISPATVTGNDALTYDAPAAQDVHLTSDGQKVTYTYQQEASTDVSTDITAPNLPAAPGTIDITMKSSSKTYDHDQAVGTQTYERLPKGQYTVTAPSYTGTDAKTYTATLSNPYTITGTSQTITITYAEVPPSTEHVTTNITAPNLPASSTVDVNCTDGGTNTYDHNQPAGSHTYDTMVDASYTCTSADYTVGADTYVATLSNPYVIDSGNKEIAITYHKEAPPGHVYDWSQSHLEAIKDANIFSIVWGGGSTTAPVHISSNPPINPRLNSSIMNYEDGTPLTLLATAAVQKFPNYLSMGTITETDAGNLATDQLKTLKMDTAFHYVGNGSGDRGCFVDGPGEAGCTETPFSATLVYDPLIDKLATQASDVKAVNNHTLVNGVAFYTIDWSDGTDTIIKDTENDQNVTMHMYNLMYEAQLMENEYTQNSIPMVMFLNPDSVYPFQQCGQWYCPIAWKPGITQDTTSKVIAIPNLKADIDAAIDRMETKGHITSGEATTLKNDLDTSGILTPPPASKRTAPGLPELVLGYNWVMKKFGQDVPFGWGMNFYDSANPVLNPDGKAKDWQTASADWIHKINHLGLTPAQVSAGIANDAQMLANYVADMNFLGNSSGDYKPDFIYFDKYERDPLPGSIGQGFAFNGVDWDTYLEYVKDFETDSGHPPVALWQIPGASIQVSGATFSGTLGATAENWAFGSPDLNNNFSNWDSTQETAINVAWTQNYDTNIYYTKNSGIADLKGYLMLGAGSP